MKTQHTDSGILSTDDVTDEDISDDEFHLSDNNSRDPESRKGSSGTQMSLIPNFVRSGSVGGYKDTGKSGKVKENVIPKSGMLTLSFRSKVEREFFSNALHLCNPSITFSSDCQMLEGKDTVCFRCSTLNAIGMHSEIVLLINCKKSKIWFGEDGDSPSASVEDVICTPSLTNKKRLDIQYPTSETSVGSRILQSHDDTTESKMTTMSLLFASAFLKSVAQVSSYFAPLKS